MNSEDDPFDLPFPKFVGWAIEENKTEPEHYDTSNGKPYHTPLWTFTRWIKGYLWDRDGMTADIAFDKVDSVIQDWGDDWATHFDVDDDEHAYEEFVVTWPKVLYPAGLAALDTAMRYAQLTPLELRVRKSRPLPRYQLFVSVAGWLQANMGDAPIWLPCKKVSELFTKNGVPCNKMRVSRWREMAVSDGYLTEVEPHTRGPNGLATRYRFDVTLYDCLIKHRQQSVTEEKEETEEMDRD